MKRAPVGERVEQRAVEFRDCVRVRLLKQDLRDNDSVLVVDVPPWEVATVERCPFENSFAEPSAGNKLPWNTIAPVMLPNAPVLRSLLVMSAVESTPEALL